MLTHALSCSNMLFYFGSIYWGVSCSNFFTFWITMEINLMTFAFMMAQSVFRETKAMVLNYFIIQSYFSIVLLGVLMLGSLFSYDTFDFFCKLVLLGKLGVAPFHVWFVMMVVVVEWNKLTLLLSWQKVLPLFGLSQLGPAILSSFILLNISIVVINSYSQLMLKYLLSYSSIFNVIWMMLLTSELNIMFSFFISYILSFLPVLQMNYFVDMNNITKSASLKIPSVNKVIYLFSLLSMGGIPPTLGFWGKFLLLAHVSLLSHNALGALVLMSSVYVLYFYIRLCVFMLQLSKLTIANQGTLKLSCAFLPVSTFMFSVFMYY